MMDQQIDLDIDGDGESDVKIVKTNGTKIWFNLSSLKRLCMYLSALCVAALGYTQM